MIKYLELTAPSKDEFRQAKILSVEINEGDHVEIGDALFRVKSGDKEIDLPSTMKGNVTEIIACVDENITILTPLLLLETVVAESTASQPITEAPEKKVSASKGAVQKGTGQTDSKKKEKKKVEKKKAKKKAASKKEKKSSQKKTLHNDLEKQLAQQTLDLMGEADIQNELGSVPENSNQKDSLTTPSVLPLLVPDIGGDSAKVVEILVKVGDQIAIDDPVVTLESDKASMEVPSNLEGIVHAVVVSLDQDVSQDSILLEVVAHDATQSDNSSANTSDAAEAATAANSAAASSTQLIEIKVPDIGGDQAKVVEILVSVGQMVDIEDGLITLESDKASMEVPSSAAGNIQSIEVALDQEIGEGAVIVTLVSSQVESATQPSVDSAASSAQPPYAAQPAPTQSAKVAEPVMNTEQNSSPGKSHASPSIRRFARELGVELSNVNGSGRKGRITKPDVKQFVKGVMSGASKSTTTEATGSGIPAVPAIDFSRFGEIDIQPLNRIKRLTAANLHRSWLNVPHVTHADESDITGLDEFRKQLNKEYAQQKRDIKLSPLAFIVKAVVNALQTFPQFNSSLEPGGENLIYKKYINIGIAVETPNGLVVPVVKDADKMTLREIAESMGELAAKARDKKLSVADMSGSCFTISSLGGIGGTHFTPIVNAPEVAILGVSRGKIQPHWNGEEFKPTLMLPLSLSYDHRVIDGAEAARFTRHIAAILEDVRRLSV